MKVTNKILPTERVKTSEGENTEQSNGSIKVWFGNQVEVNFFFALKRRDLTKLDVIRIKVYLFFKAHPHHFGSRVPLGSAHPDLCEIH